MNYQLTSRQQEIVDMARSLAPKFAERASEHDRENTFPFENYDDLKQAGYHTITVPRKFSGGGAGLYDLCLGQEQIAIGDGATALGIGMHLSLIGRIAEEETWPDDLWTRVCTDVVEKGALINSAATEPNMGSPSRGGAPVTTARRTSDGWEINGRKTFTTIAPALYYVIVLAWVEEEEKRAQFLFRTDTPGLRIDETWDTLGMRATASHDLVLEGVRIPESARIRTNPSPQNVGPGRGWAALTLGATYLGIAAAALEFTSNYAQHRVPTALGKPISELDNIQERVGKMDLTIRAARSVLINTAQAWEEHPDKREDLTPDIAASKYLATNCATEVTDEAMRLVGGAALSRKLPLERLFRDARAGLYNPPADYETLKLLGQWNLGKRPSLR